MFHGALSGTRSSMMGTITLRSRAIDASASTQLTSEPSSGAKASGVQQTTTQRALASSALMTAAKLWPASSSWSNQTVTPSSSSAWEISRTRGRMRLL
jgi:hypothetical protein